ncbi:MAG: HEAT repeat domain-containing protein [Pirellulales bacterium]|nr:HEAT repeat domain-containing protein [Pirellulales bacterium]
MISHRNSLVIAVMMVAAAVHFTTPVALVAEDEQPLIELLQSDVPKADKALACRKLAVWGSHKAVPALAALLHDPELESWARIALEVIPDPAADGALRQAMGQLEGRSLMGVIHSIGVRRDEQAVDGLIKHMRDADPGIASAAAVALGHIGNAPATAALRQALVDTPEAVRSAVAEGCILCAEKMLNDGKKDQAAGLYDAVRTAGVPKPRIVEATRGAILARGADGVGLLVEQLVSSDQAMVAIGLSTARELTGPGVSKKLLASLTRMAPDRQAMLILAIADRGDSEAMPAMLDAAKDGPVPVRVAAIEVLKRLGDATCIPVLLIAATEENEEVARTATAALQELPGNHVDRDLVARLNSAKGKERIVLLELVGRRRMDAVPPLLAAIDDADGQVRTAALVALGEVAQWEDLPELIDRVVDPPRSDDTPAASRALQAACLRMPDREACARKLADALERAPKSAQIAILETLTGMGGTKALQTIVEAAKSEDPQIQDTAVRLLGTWMTLEAGPGLLELAKTPNSPYKVRALRGYIRLARQFLMPDDQRAAMCKNALDAAERDAERELVLQVMERYPSVPMLRLAVESAKNPALRDKATGVAMTVASKIGGGADVQKLFEQVQREPVKVEILKATYGAGDTLKDVTSILQKHARDFPLIVLPSSSYNEAFGGDPIPNVVKQLKVQYRMDGKSGEVVFPENAPILLP